MKKFLMFLCLIIPMFGCVSVSPDGIPDNDKQKLQEMYKEITTREKTLKNAFGAWKFYTTFVNYKGTHGCRDGYNYGYTAYRFRFCDNEKSLKPDNGISYSIYVTKLFDQGILTDEEKYCMENKCVENRFYGFIPEKSNYLHNEDECILIRRRLLDDPNIRDQCIFNYKNYIPKNLKINNLKEFEELYKAYDSSIEDCKYKKVNYEFTTGEYEECLNSVEQRLEELAQTGTLKETSIYNDSLDKVREDRLVRAKEEKKKGKENNNMINKKIDWEPLLLF